MKFEMKDKIISLLVLLIPTLLLGLPVVVLASILGVGGLQGLLLGFITAICHFTLVILVITFFKLEDHWRL